MGKIFNPHKWPNSLNNKGDYYEFHGAVTHTFFFFMSACPLSFWTDTAFTMIVPEAGKSMIQLLSVRRIFGKLFIRLHSVDE